MKETQWLPEVLWHPALHSRKQAGEWVDRNLWEALTLSRARSQNWSWGTPAPQPDLEHNARSRSCPLVVKYGVLLECLAPFTENGREKRVILCSTRFFTNGLFGSKPMKYHSSLPYSRPKRKLSEVHIRNSTATTRPPGLFAECLLQRLCFASNILNQHFSIMYLHTRKLCYLDYVFQIVRQIPQILQPTFSVLRWKHVSFPPAALSPSALVFCSCLTKKLFSWKTYLRIFFQVTCTVLGFFTCAFFSIVSHKLFPTLCKTLNLCSWSCFRWCFLLT